MSRTTAADTRRRVSPAPRRSASSRARIAGRSRPIRAIRWNFRCALRSVVSALYRYCLRPHAENPGACLPARVRFGLGPHHSVVSVVAERIATITLNRPDKLNALNHITIPELGAAVKEARADPTVGGIILT